MNRSLHGVAAAVAALSACAGSAVFAAPPARHAADVQRALAAIQRQPEAALAAAEDRFEAFDVIRDADGAAHVRFDRKFKGLPVIGGDMVVHLDGGGALKRVSKTLARQLDLEVSPAFDQAAAEALAVSRFARVRGQRPAGSELVVYALNAAPLLAWDVLATGAHPNGLPIVEHLIVDARDGRLLDRWDTAKSADALGSGHGFYTGTIALHADQLAGGGYQLVDRTRGDQTINDMGNKDNGEGSVMTDADNVWGNGDMSDRATAAVDAQFGIGKTWDYYRDTFGRNGIRDDGVAGEGHIHWGQKVGNAQWDEACFCMRYGDGDGVKYGPFVTIDITGHEMTHGVTDATARLLYARESGALNEATSDILGSMVEYYVNAAFDPPDYKIGEQVFLDRTGGPALRYMYHPSIDSDSSDDRSVDCYYPGMSKGIRGFFNVHSTSGVANHFFYLLAEGPNPVGGPASPVCLPGDKKQASGTALKPTKGIGRDAAQRIWYRALTVYMTSNTDYRRARKATLDAATDLFGTGSLQVKAVAQAWSAVNVN